MASGIETSISRIAGNVAAALSKIAAKGVTVPSGATSDDLETLIGQITASVGETWVVTLKDGTTIEKEVVVNSVGG